MRSLSASVSISRVPEFTRASTIEIRIGDALICGEAISATDINEITFEITKIIAPDINYIAGGSSNGLVQCIEQIIDEINAPRPDAGSAASEIYGDDIDGGAAIPGNSARLIGSNTIPDPTRAISATDQIGRISWILRFCIGSKIDEMQIDNIPIEIPIDPPTRLLSITRDASAAPTGAVLGIQLKSSAIATSAGSPIPSIHAIQPATNDDRIPRGA